MDFRLEEDTLEKSSEAFPFFLAGGDDEDLGDSAESFVKLNIEQKVIQLVKKISIIT